MSLFSINTYNDEYKSSFSQITASDSVICKASLHNDCVLSSCETIIQNISELSGSVNNLANLSNSLSNLSARAENNFNVQSNFDIYTYSISTNDAKTIEAPDKVQMNMLSTTLNDALQSSGSETISKYFNFLQTTIRYNTNVRSLYSILKPGKIITINDVYVLFSQIAGILEKIKLFRWNYYFSINSFKGGLYLHNCANIYPELPVLSSQKNSFYSAALVSPYTTNANIKVFEDHSGTITENVADASGRNKLIASSVEKVDISLLNNNVLIFTDEYTDDIQTIDTTNAEGSNGQCRVFKKITTNTYPLQQKLNSIYQLFGLSAGNVLSYKKVKQAISYLFELWQCNLQVFQCDFYSCHYNCHGNAINNNNPGVNDTSIVYYTFSITCTRVDSSFDDSEFKNVLNLFSFQPYKATYSFKRTNTIPYNPKIDEVSIEIPYLEYLGNDSSTIPISVECEITDIPNLGDTKKFIVFPGIRTIGNFNSNQSITLKVQDFDTSFVKEDLANNLISCIGNLNFKFSYANTGSTKERSIADPDNCRLIDRVTRSTSISPGDIYIDIDSSIASWLDMSKRENATFSLNYQPQPIVQYKENGTWVDVDDSNFEYSWLESDDKDLGTVYVIAKSESKYDGIRTASYSIGRLPKIELSNPDVSGISAGYIGAIDDIYIDDDLTVRQPPVSVLEKLDGVIYKSNDTATSAAFYKLFNLTYNGSGSVGNAYVILKPAEYIAGKYGESYYIGEKQLATYRIKQRTSLPQDINIGNLKLRHVTPINVIGLESDASKTSVVGNANFIDTTSESFNVPTTAPDSRYRQLVFTANDLPSDYEDYIVQYKIVRPSTDAEYFTTYIGVELNDGTTLANTVIAARLKKGGSEYADDYAEGVLKFKITKDNANRSIVCSVIPLSPNADKLRNVRLGLYY